MAPFFYPSTAYLFRIYIPVKASLLFILMLLSVSILFGQQVV